MSRTRVIWNLGRFWLPLSWREQPGHPLRTAGQLCRCRDDIHDVYLSSGVHCTASILPPVRVDAFRRSYGLVLDGQSEDLDCSFKDDVAFPWVDDLWWLELAPPDLKT